MNPYQSGEEFSAEIDAGYVPLDAPVDVPFDPPQGFPSLQL
jgi:hypothetical protein